MILETKEEITYYERLIKENPKELIKRVRYAETLISMGGMLVNTVDTLNGIYKGSKVIRELLKSNKYLDKKTIDGIKKYFKVENRVKYIYYFNKLSEDMNRLGVYIDYIRPLEFVYQSNKKFHSFVYKYENTINSSIKSKAEQNMYKLLTNRDFSILFEDKLALLELSYFSALIYMIENNGNKVVDLTQGEIYCTDNYTILSTDYLWNPIVKGAFNTWFTENFIKIMVDVLDKELNIIMGVRKNGKKVTIQKVTC